MPFINNSTDTVAVERDNIKALIIYGLLIVFKMNTGPDIIYEEAQDESQLQTLRVRTWNQLIL